MLVGPYPPETTALARGTKFVAPTGSGNVCSVASPCSLATAAAIATAGDVVFLRGGTYVITTNISFASSGTAQAPITFESYPGEWAILDGSTLGTSAVYLRVSGSYNAFRRLEIANMPKTGLRIEGTFNLVEGVLFHHNKLAGLHITAPYTLPYGAQGSYNTVHNCIFRDNSGAGLTGEYANGGNTDGISVSAGDGNRITNCLAQGNSDDGFDTWRSTNAYIGYSIATANGLGGGDGNGFKAGGAAPSRGTIVEHSISYANHATGFDFNSGLDVQFNFNTSFGNASFGFYAGPSSIVHGNISVQDGQTAGPSGTLTNNSWQRTGTPVFVNQTSGSADFFRPTATSGFTDLGAYAGLRATTRVVLVGDSTVASYPASRAPLAGWGSAFPSFFDAHVVVDNRAVSGESSASFIANGLWAPIPALLQPRDVVFIQFGHNDEGTGVSPVDFGRNLHFYVQQVRLRRAVPVLVTPVTRRRFDASGMVPLTHPVTTPVVLSVGAQAGVAAIDLDQQSRAVVQSAGVDGSKQLFLHLDAGVSPNYPAGIADDTHFQTQGARRMAELVKSDQAIRALPIGPFVVP